MLQKLLNKYWSKLRSKKWLMILVFPIWLVASFFLSQLIISAILIVLKFFGISSGMFNQTIFNSFIDVLVYSMTLLLLILPYYIKKDCLKLSDVGFKRLMSWGDILLSIAGLFIYLILSSCLILLISKIFPYFDINQTQETGFDNLYRNYEYILAFLVLVVIVPVAEETLFRGFLYDRLKKYAPIWLSVLITSLTFGLLHMQPSLIIDTFALSVVLCVLREITGSIWAPILLHMIKNGIAFFILFIYPLILTTLG